MTRDEIERLRQEAEEKHNHIKSVAEDYVSKSWNTLLYLDETDLIMAGIGVGKIIADEQKKRIEELEEENRQLKNEVEDLTGNCARICDFIRSVLLNTQNKGD